jgi:hypothetical protein
MSIQNDPGHGALMDRHKNQTLETSALKVRTFDLLVRGLFGSELA